MTQGKDKDQEKKALKDHEIEVRKKLNAQLIERSREMIQIELDMYQNLQTETNIGYIRFIEDMALIIEYAARCRSGSDRIMHRFDVDRIEEKMQAALERLKRSEQDYGSV